MNMNPGEPQETTARGYQDVLTQGDLLEQVGKPPERKTSHPRQEAEPAAAWQVVMGKVPGGGPARDQRDA